MAARKRTRTLASKIDRELNPGAPSERAPSERWQHADREIHDLNVDSTGSVRVERVSSGLTATTTADHDTAARRWRRSYEASFGVGRGTAMTLDRMRVDTSASGASDGGMSFRLDAITAYKEASQAVGLRGDALLQLAVGQGIALSKIESILSGNDAAGAPLPVSTTALSSLPAELQQVAARIRRMDRKALAGALSATLDRLAEHYDAVDRARAAASAARKAAALDAAGVKGRAA